MDYKMDYKRRLVSEISSIVQARINCRVLGNTDWFDQYTAELEMLCRDFMPSGSGFDSGTKIDLDQSHADKLVFTTSCHHMNSDGYYDGWTHHIVTVTPGFTTMRIRIGGRDKNSIKDHVYEAFYQSLNTLIDWDTTKTKWVRA